MRLRLRWYGWLLVLLLILGAFWIGRELTRQRVVIHIVKPVYKYYLPVVYGQGAWKGITVAQPGDEKKLNSSWSYTWWYKGGNLGPTSEWVPMFRTYNPTSGYSSTIPLAPQYAQQYANKYVLAFNEPDGSGQDDLTLDQLVDNWHQLEMALPNSKLVGPGLLNLAWFRYNLDEWLGAYEKEYGRGPYMSALAVHYYHEYSLDPNVPIPWVDKSFPYRASFRAWMDYLKETLINHHYGVLPIWLTEFGYMPTTTWSPMNKEVATGLNSWLSLIRSDRQIARFAYFCDRGYLASWTEGGLIDKSNNLTQAGQVYRDH